MITKPHVRPFTYPITQEYASLGLDPTKIESLYLFDTASNLYDASGNQRHGDISTSSGFSPAGRFGVGSRFDGVDDYMRIANFNPTGNGNKEVSIHFYYRPITSANALYVVSHWDQGAATNQKSWTIKTRADGAIQVILSTDGINATKLWNGDAGFLVVGEYNCFTIVYDGTGVDGDIKIYKNSVESTAYTKVNDGAMTTLHASTADLTIGDGLDNNLPAGGPINGDMDLLLIYSGILNINQIQNLCNKGL